MKRVIVLALAALIATLTAVPALAAYGGGYVTKTPAIGLTDSGLTDSGHGK
jgi:drug/metabolite transporter superfamily protein YnfA